MRNLKAIVRALHDRYTLRPRAGNIGIGLIGIGGWGGTNAANIMRSRRFCIRGAFDVNESALERFGGRFGVEGFDSAEALFSCPEVEAVCITVPNHLHGPLIRAAADAGKAIFVEKPLASTVEECRALEMYCAERGGLLQVGHQMRRDPVFRALKGLLDSGDLGDAIYSQGVYTAPGGNQDTWRGDADCCPGGSMEQIGIHLIDTLIYLHGLPLKSGGWARNIPRTSGGPDCGNVSLTFERNIRANVTSIYGTARHFSLNVFCTGGVISTDGSCLLIAGYNQKATRRRIAGIPGGVAQFTAFAECIERGIPPETGATEAIAVMNVIQSMPGSNFS